MNITGAKLFVKALREEKVDVLLDIPADMLSLSLMNYMMKILHGVPKRSMKPTKISMMMMTVWRLLIIQGKINNFPCVLISQVMYNDCTLKCAYCRHQRKGSITL